MVQSCSVRAKLFQLYLTICDSMGYSLPDSSVYGILQARVLEWIAIWLNQQCVKICLPQILFDTWLLVLVQLMILLD